MQRKPLGPCLQLETSVTSRCWVSSVWIKTVFVGQWCKGCFLHLTVTVLDEYKAVFETNEKMFVLVPALGSSSARHLGELLCTQCVPQPVDPVSRSEWRKRVEEWDYLLVNVEIHDTCRVMWALSDLGGDSHWALPNLLTCTTSRFEKLYVWRLNLVVVDPIGPFSGLESGASVRNQATGFPISLRCLDWKLEVANITRLWGFLCTSLPFSSVSTSSGSSQEWHPKSQRFAVGLCLHIRIVQ